MPRNGSGTYTLPQPAFVPNTTISSSAVNSDFSDIAAALTNSIAVDGQTPITGQLQFPSGTAVAPSHTFSTDTGSGMYLFAAGILGLGAGAGLAAVLVNSTNVGTGKNGNQLQYGNGSFPCPVGMVVDFAGSAAPSGWFLCYGQALSQTSYPELFTVIGTTYGGSGGNFNLPDLRGRATFGVDNMGGSAAGRITIVNGDNFDGTILGNSGGIDFQVLGVNNLGSHNHSVTVTLNDPGHTHGTTGTTGLRVLNLNIGGSNDFTISGTHSLLALDTLNTVSNTTGITTNPATTSNTGSATAFGIMPPAMTLNKIIFAGRP